MESQEKPGNCFVLSVIASIEGFQYAACFHQIVMRGDDMGRLYVTKWPGWLVSGEKGMLGVGSRSPECSFTRF